MRTLLLVFVVSLAIGSIPLALDLFPPPAIHDEFAYLLQADTFARGRVTNPPPAHREFFESMHILTTPTYTAKFPPGQALTLAAGMRFGSPRVGVIVTIALACAAVAWMLRAAMPWRWAGVGGLLAATHPLVLSWSQSYWGGGVAMLGGALAGGAALRLAKAPSIIGGIIFAVGAAMLANSRPFEGLILLTVLFAWVMYQAERREHWSALLWRSAPPILLLGIATLAAMAGYNHRVTGNALRLPYAEYARQYMTAPLFWWQQPTSAPLYGNDAMAKFHGEVEWEEYARQRGVAGFVAGVWQKSRQVARDWFWPPTLVLPLTGLWWLRRSWRATLPAAVWLIVPAVHFVLTPWFRPHYLAVSAGFFFLLMAMGLRVLLRRGRFGVLMICAVLGVQAATAAWELSGLMFRPNPAGYPRQMFIEAMTREPGEHLVFVRYETGRQSVVEWVYNTAEIDAQQIIFARDLGEHNETLRRDYPNRKAWRAIVGDYAYRLSPIESAVP